MDKEKREIRNDLIIELRNNNVSYRDIAKSVDMSSAGVHKVVQQFLNGDKSNREREFRSALLESANWENQLTDYERKEIPFVEAKKRVLERIFEKYNRKL